eukprot:TRINITY_DN6310_c2_g1_i1.p1 TRINITY_DN6310_c2_g1~~TRINITY_DN6310_c2_g1_i1.p1  ORF type:complete len:277 (+),score=85.22 TRINITY_DN6310_c2_g1_i1:163-993(+)
MADNAGSYRFPLLALALGAFVVVAYLFNPSHDSGDLTHGVEALKRDVLDVLESAGRPQQEPAPTTSLHSWEHHPIPIAHRPRWRYQLAEILEMEGKTEGAEIGVQRARFSKDMLRMWPGCTKYILVDVWEQQANYADAANVKDQDSLYKEMLVNVQPYIEKIVVMRNWSHDAAKRLNDSSLDFVYIDARHDFEAVLEDLRDWWPKLRVGGIFAGHDFTSAKSVPGFSLQRDGTRNVGAVRGAVIHFAKEMGIPYHVLPERKGNKKAPFASWMMRKN